MPKRNLVWLAIGVVIAVLLWKLPPAFIRQDTLLNQFGPLLDVRVQILKNYVEPVDDQVLLRGAIDGMLNKLDPYSEYYDETEQKQIQKVTEGQFEGIGIEVGPLPGGGLVIVSPIEGSPAFRAGLLAGDRIVEIDGTNAESMELAEGVALITGKRGTDVTLTVLRPSTGQTLKKTITRGVITVRTVRGWARDENWEWDYLIDPEERIGYVRISRFEGPTAEQVDAVLRELLTRHRMRGLILDLRDNPGGLLPEVVDIANRFIRDGVIVSTKARNGPEHPYIAVPERAFPHFPMVVLVNHGSASASEILSGALKDHGRAIIVGEQTFGKGSVQELRPLENGRGALKLTTAYYYLPRGERIHGKGVTPDRVVNLTPEERTRLIESQMAVYSTSLTPTTTQAATAPATASAPSLVGIDVSVDRQLQEALSILRARLATQPAT
jgi:carboxyl-terminal processing protease